MIITNVDEMSFIGVYKIINTVNNKIYIGSTTVSFKERYRQHLYHLKKNTHKNTHLQHAFNKYGESKFEFCIIECCDKESCIIVEQKWLNDTNCTEKSIGYNINPLADRINTPEVYEKRRQTMLRKYANGELEHVREKSRKIGDRKRGIKLDDTKHLKVSKTITDKVLESRRKRMEIIRESLPRIYVYDINGVFLGEWRSIPDLIDYSKSEYNNLPILSRFPNGRVINNTKLPTKVLRNSNIQSSIKNNTSYKNLYFSYLPLL